MPAAQVFARLQPTAIGSTKTGIDNAEKERKSIFATLAGGKIEIVGAIAEIISKIAAVLGGNTERLEESDLPNESDLPPLPAAAQARQGSAAPLILAVVVGGAAILASGRKKKRK